MISTYIYIPKVFLKKSLKFKKIKVNNNFSLSKFLINSRLDDSNFFFYNNLLYLLYIYMQEIKLFNGSNVEYGLSLNYLKKKNYGIGFFFLKFLNSRFELNFNSSIASFYFHQ